MFKKIISFFINILFALIIIFSITPSCRIVSINAAQINFFRNENFDYVMKYNGQSQKNNTFLSMSDTLSIYHGDKKIFCDTLMQQEDVTEESIFEVNSKLKSDEIAISHNLIKNLGLHYGDILTCKTPFEDAIYEFKITEIVKNCFGVETKALNERKGIAIIGYYENFVTSKTPFLSFIKNQDLTNVGITVLSLKSKSYFIDDLVNINSRMSVVQNLILFFVSIFSLLLDLFFNQGRIKFNLNKGRSTKHVYLQYMMPSVIKSLFLFCSTFFFTLIYGLCITGLDSFNFGSLFFIFTPTIVAAIGLIVLALWKRSN